MGDNRKPHRNFTQEQVRAMFDYVVETGDLIWLGSRKRGHVAGTLRNGYMRVRIGGKSYVAHRIIWLWVYGSWPKEQIDHINGVRNDNRLCNLREASHGQNSVNKVMSNASPYGRRVSLRRNGTFEVRANVQGKIVYVGTFRTVTEAQAAAFNAHKNKEFMPNERHKVT